MILACRCCLHTMCFFLKYNFNRFPSGVRLYLEIYWTKHFFFSFPSIFVWCALERDTNDNHVCCIDNLTFSKKVIRLITYSSKKRLITYYYIVNLNHYSISHNIFRIIHFLVESGSFFYLCNILLYCKSKFIFYLEFFTFEI